MKPKFLYLITILLASLSAAVLITILTGCGAERDASASIVSQTAVSPTGVSPPISPDEVDLPKDSPKLGRVRVETVQQAMVPADEITAPGRVMINPNRVSHIVLPVAGRVTTVAVKIGDFVQQGQPLLTVEGSDIDAAISGYHQAEAAVTTAKSAEAKAQSDKDRTSDLFEHNAIAQKEVINADAVLTQAKAAVEQSDAGLAQAKRRLELLGIQPDQYGQKVTVRAPLSGKVMELTVVPGEFRNDTSASLMTIADLSSVWITSSVPETSIRFIQPGEHISVELSAYPGEAFPARVTQIADTVDPATRTIEVRAELDNRKGKLRPEMFGQIRHTEKMEMRPVIPAAAVVQEDGRNVVWMQAAPGKYRRTPVELGSRMNDRQAIDKGLKSGDQIVVDGVMLLKAN